MKSLLSIVLLSLSLPLFAQDELNHLTLCKSADAINARGENGTCSLVMTINKNKSSNVVKCTGILMNVLPCTMNYLVGASYSTMSFACGTDPLKPTIKQTLAAEATTYAVAALIQNENGERTLLNDPKSYVNLTSRMMTLDIVTQVVDGKEQTSVSAAIKLADFQALTNVICQ